MGLRAQLALIVVVLAVGSVWLIGSVVLNLTEQALVEQQERVARSLATQVAEEAAGGLDLGTGLALEPNYSAISTAISPITQLGLFQRVDVHDRNGSLVTGFPRPGGVLPGLDAPLATDRPQTHVLDHPDWGLSLIIDTQLVVDDRVVGTLRAVSSLAQSLVQLRAAQLMTALFSLLAAVLIFTIGYFFLTRMIVTPIRRIGVAAQRVAAGDHASRVALSSHNEIGRVATHFNGMLDQLEAGRESLQQKVTALEAAKSELEQAQEAIIRSEKLASIGRMAAGIAHEVGNPLSAVVGLVELLHDDDGLAPEDRADALGRIESELMRIHRTIRELLDYSREERDPAASGSVSEVIDAVAKLVSHQPKFREVEISMDLPPGLPAVRVNPDQLTQVVLNLMINAADALDGRGKIHVSARRDQSEVWLNISDDGPGIPETERAQLFEPFFTTKPPGEGTGLGLAICERIVADAGGRIEVANAEGGGAIFSIVVPVSTTASHRSIEA